VGAGTGEIRMATERGNSNRVAIAEEIIVVVREIIHAATEIMLQIILVSR
jgi:hypothetical protein